MSQVRKLFVALAIAALPVIAGCSASTTAPSPTPFPMTRLYVTNDGGSGVVQIFAPTFSNTSTPAVSFKDGASSDVDDVAFDPLGRLYVGAFDLGKVDVFTPPFSNTSTSTFSITTGISAPEGVDVDLATGNLGVANEGSSKVTLYTAPLSGTSAPAVTISTGVVGPIGLKHDALSLYVANSNGTITIYNAPYSNTSAPAVTIPVADVWGIFIDSVGNLWAVHRIAPLSVMMFTRPFTNTSTPALTIPTGTADALYPAIDFAGDLFLSTGAGISVYLAPLSASSTAAFSFPTVASNGIRFGP